MEQAVLALSLLQFNSHTHVRVPTPSELLDLKRKIEYHKGILYKENALIQSLAIETKTPYVCKTLKK